MPNQTKQNQIGPELGTAQPQLVLIFFRKLEKWTKYANPIKTDPNKTKLALSLAQLSPSLFFILSNSSPSPFQSKSNGLGVDFVFPCHKKKKNYPTTI